MKGVTVSDDSEPTTERIPAIEPAIGPEKKTEEELSASKRESPSTESKPDLSDEEAFEAMIPDPSSFKRLRRPKRKVIKFKDEKYLIISRSEITERGMFGVKLDWNNKVSDLRLLKNGLVDHLHARKVPIAPLDDEDEIRCLMRHNWWSHGPKQLLILLYWLLGICVIVLALSSVDRNWGAAPITTGAITVTGILWTVFWATRYYPVWMQWAYDWIIVTDKRLILTYDPPFKLPGKNKTVMLASIITVDTEDPNWFQNLIGCGKVQVRTADNDQELDELLEYVNRHHEVRELLISSLG
jgi:hypothetical protein